MALDSEWSSRAFRRLTSRLLRGGKSRLMLCLHSSLHTSQIQLTKHHLLKLSRTSLGQSQVTFFLLIGDVKARNLVSWPCLNASLTGLTLDAQLEPSHALVDRIVAMAEEQSVCYVELPLCTSTETEVNMLKKEPALEFTSDGSICLSKKHHEAAADTGELRVRLCMQRRALAFQLANIASFVTLDTFIAKLLALLTKKSIPGYRNVSLSQIVAADQALWQKVSQETRGMILTSGDPKPVDKAVMEVMDCAEVTYHLLPRKDSHNPDKPPNHLRIQRIPRKESLEAEWRCWSSSQSTKDRHPSWLLCEGWFKPEHWLWVQSKVLSGQGSKVSSWFARVLEEGLLSEACVPRLP